MATTRKTTTSETTQRARGKAAATGAGTRERTAAKAGGKATTGTKQRAAAKPEAATRKTAKPKASPTARPAAKPKQTAKPTTKKPDTRKAQKSDTSKAARKPAQTKKAQKPTTARKPVETKKTQKPTVAAQTPTETKKPTAAAQKPTETKRPTAAAQKPAETKRPTAAAQKPAETNTTQKPTAAQQPAETNKTQKPTAAQQPAETNTTRKPTAAQQLAETNTTRKPAAAQKPAETKRPTAAAQKPAETKKSTAAAQKSAETKKPTAAAQQPAETNKTRKPTAAQKPAEKRQTTHSVVVTKRPKFERPPRDTAPVAQASAEAHRGAVSGAARASKEKPSAPSGGGITEKVRGAIETVRGAVRAVKALVGAEDEAPPPRPAPPPVPERWKVLGDLAAWRKMPVPPKLVLSRQLAAALGNDYQPISSVFGAAGLAGVRHTPTGTIFLAIPGGIYDMGISEAEAAAALAALDVDEEQLAQINEELAAARPVHPVAVPPFLCARTPMLTPLAERLVDAKAGLRTEPAAQSGTPAVLVTAGDVKRAVSRSGWRLLSEAEWEWVAREGGAAGWLNASDASSAEAACAALYEAGYDEAAAAPSINGFGLWGLPWGDWVADSWHDNYRGAPNDGRAWDPASAISVYRGGATALYPWQGSELVMSLAGHRSSVAARSELRLGLRFALDLPK